MYLQKTRRLLYNRNGVKREMLSVTDVRQFYLGVQGENEEQTITVDVRPWLASYPNGVVSIWHKRNGESVPTQTGATFDPEEGTITWVPTYTDTYVAGEGEAEVRLYDNGVIKKTRKVKTGVAPSVTGAAGVTLESGWQGYINYIDSQAQAAISAKEDAEDAKEDAQAAQTAAETAQGLAEDAQLGAENAQTAAETAQGKAEDAQEAAEDAQDAAETAVEHYPYVDETTGDWFVWDADNGEWVDTGVHAKGDTGTVPDISVGTVTTLQPDQPATVTRRQGSPDTAPIFDFGIPKGETGQAGNIYGNTIDMSSSDSTKVSAAINEKASKVASATENNFAALDANGDLKDSGHKHSDYLTSHQDISGKADKVSGGTENNFAALDSNGNLKDSGHKHSDYLTSHQDISGKADKVSSATSGDFAALDGNGNLTDSGHKHADYKTAQTAVTDPSASGTTDQFIATISQDANGVITPTKKTVQDATTSAHGLMSASDKSKLDNISQMTKRYVTLAVATSEWTLSSGVYTAEFTTAYVTATSHEKIFWDKAYFDYAVTAVDATKKSGGGGVILTTATIPTGTIQGQLEIIDNDDGKIPTIIEATTVPIANGGTGASNLAGAKANLEIPTVVNVLNSSSTADALSAAKGKELAEQISNKFGGGRVRLVSIATDNSTVGFKLDYPSGGSFTILYTDSAHRVASITKSTNQVPTNSDINSSFASTSFSSTTTYLRVGNYCRGTFLIDTASTLTITTYVS